MRTTATFAFMLATLLCLSAADARPTKAPAPFRARVSAMAKRLFRRAPAKAMTKTQKATKPRARRGTLVRNLKAKVIKTRRKLADWWRWQRKKDWKLVETHLADFNPSMQPSSLNPYSWSVWKDKRTGRKRTTTEY